MSQRDGRVRISLIVQISFVIGNIRKFINWRKFSAAFYVSVSGK